MKERDFARKIKNGLESVGCFCFNVHGHRMQRGGVPDIYVAHNRWTGWIEFNVGNYKPTDLQIMRMKDLLIRNVPAFVVRFKDGIIYCELWGGSEFETLSYCDQWKRWKGQTLGKGLLKMFDEAGKTAIKIIIGD